jgi:hypothetical protein
LELESANSLLPVRSSIPHPPDPIQHNDLRRKFFAAYAAKEGMQRKMCMLEWNSEDVGDVYLSLLRPRVGSSGQQAEADPGNGNPGSLQERDQADQLGDASCEVMALALPFSEVLMADEMNPNQ